MKLGKKVKKVKESPKPPSEEPSEPKVVQRRHTVCKITEESTDLLFDDGLNLMVEGVGEPLFEKEVEGVLPKTDFWKKDIVYHISPKHKAFVLEIAKDYFSEILYFNAEGRLEKIRGNYP